MINFLLSFFLMFGAFGQKKNTNTKPQPRPPVENIIMKPIKGWKVSYENKTSKQMVIEFVPIPESKQNWSQMITLNVFYKAPIALKAIRNDMIKGFKRLCPKSEFKLVSTKKSNNYDTETFRVTCPLSAATGRTEVTHFKTIRGNDNVYMVQYAFRLPRKVASLKDEQEKGVYAYLDELIVCDNRHPKHPCPPPIKKTITKRDDSKKKT